MSVSLICVQCTSCMHKCVHCASLYSSIFKNLKELKRLNIKRFAAHCRFQKQKITRPELLYTKIHSYYIIHCIPITSYNPIKLYIRVCQLYQLTGEILCTGF